MQRRREIAFITAIIIGLIVGRFIKKATIGLVFGLVLGLFAASIMTGGGDQSNKNKK